MFNFGNWKPQEIQQKFSFMNKVQIKISTLYDLELLYVQIQIHPTMDRFIFDRK